VQIIFLFRTFTCVGICLHFPDPFFLLVLTIFAVLDCTHTHTKSDILLLLQSTVKSLKYEGKHQVI